MRKLLFMIGLGLLTACGNPSAETEFPPFGVWALADAESRISFVSVKKETVAETHDLDGKPSLIGSVHADGQAVVQIVLDGIESHIDVRNVRMREHLFETRTHPFATLTTQIDVAEYQNMDIGADVHKAINVKIDLHGKSIMKRINVSVRRTDADSVLVTSRMPLKIHARDFGMEAGVMKLQTLAKLSSIAPTVDVNFTLMFER